MLGLRILDCGSPERCGDTAIVDPKVKFCKAFFGKMGASVGHGE